MKNNNYQLISCLGCKRKLSLEQGALKEDGVPIPLILEEGMLAGAAFEILPY